MELPSLPAPISDFVSYVDAHSDRDIRDLLAPYKLYEAKLREIYAQHPNSPIIADALINATPIFAGHENALQIRSRDIANETDEEAKKYILPLSDNDRKLNGSPAVVASMKEFKTNFNLFSESSLIDLDWSNVIAAGSSVVTALLPVQAPHNESRRALRTYYHEQLAPASDVDIFLYGLDEKQAIEKIKQIERRIQDSILSETTTIRTKNTITIVSEYPTRHVQIVLRLYKTVSEMLAGFDIDCSCVAYDGKQVWASPRAITAFMTQVNTVDLTRRSPSYENRLSKYSHRGFEAHWPDLDRARVDPTIFERSFSRVMGLARLLVLEKLPHPEDRDSYLAKRRAERGRPAKLSKYQPGRKLPDNIKDSHPDEVAEWVEEEDVSNYHTFTVPYGPKFNAKRIEKLLFTKDLLLNSEWNRPKDRETALHRHPAFFGSVDDVIHDCCGFCPAPKTDEDLEALEHEQKKYISGDVKFIAENPGRQSIGSFHPIENSEWTEMAYVADTTLLFQAIVDGDLEYVQDLLSREDVDVNRRDHTGRTPLHLAAMCSTPEIVQCLIDCGARIVARIIDGMTALHIAANRGNAAIVRALLLKSEANEEEEVRKENARRDARRALQSGKSASTSANVETESTGAESESPNSKFEHFMDGGESENSDRMTEGSFVKVKGSTEEDALATEEDAVANADDDAQPDVYDIGVLAWDVPVGPLHLAIIGGHLEIIEILIDNFGADVLLPVKLMYETKTPRAAILTVALALKLSLDDANNTVKLLLSKGASSAQADMKQISALHYVVTEGKILILETLFRSDGPAARNAVNHLLVSGWEHNPSVITPLLTAIRKKDMDVIETLLSNGAKTEIEFEPFALAYQRQFENSSKDPIEIKNIYQKSVSQPIIEAATAELPGLVEYFLNQGIDSNTLPAEAYEKAEYPERTWSGIDKSLLDIARSKLKDFEDFLRDKSPDVIPGAPQPLKADSHYLNGFEAGTYQRWTAVHDLEQAKGVKRRQFEQYERALKEPKTGGRDNDSAEKSQAVKALAEGYQKLLNLLQTKGAKSFYEIFPNINPPNESSNKHHYNRSNIRSKEPYTTTISYQVPSLTVEKATRYTRLFEAAWRGDMATLKILTLSETESGRPPLQVAVQDLRGFCPFSLAIIRGHERVATTILEIAIAQYQPDETAKRYKYTLGVPDSEDSDFEVSGEEDVQIHAELIDDNFSIHNVGELAANVKSKVSPMTMFTWLAEFWRTPDEDDKSAKTALLPERQANFYPFDDPPKESWDWFNGTFDRQYQWSRASLVRYAIAKNNITLLKTLLRMGAQLVAGKEDEGAFKVFDVDQGDFDFAVRLGRLKMIGEIIKSTGAGIPLQQLVQNSGIEVLERPKFYEGLSVYGRKRKDWADAGRGATRTSIEKDHPPLLSVALEGNLEAVEYFLSDAPLRRYKEFVEKHKNDDRIQSLGHARGGIDEVLGKWLAARRTLAMHMAVMSPPKEGDTSHLLLDFFIRNIPEAINVKSSSGLTPLHLAFELKRYRAAQELIVAGANQATRNTLGENILHTIMKDIGTNVPLLRSLLVLFDQSLLRAMILERCGGAEPGGLTPMAMYIKEGRIHANGSEDILGVLLEYSNGKDLEVMDGAGDYPLHSLVRQRAQRAMLRVIRYNPALLHRENATGMTPLEVIETRTLRAAIDSTPWVEVVGNSRYSTSDAEQRGILPKHASKFKVMTPGEAAKDEARKATEAEEWKRWTQPMPGQRKLVSLLDANEVAKRLANDQKRRNEETRQREAAAARGGRRGRGRGGFQWVVDQEEEADGDKEGQDEVALWMRRAQGFRNWDYKEWVREVERKGKSAGADEDGDTQMTQGD